MGTAIRLRVDICRRVRRSANTSKLKQHESRCEKSMAKSGGLSPIRRGKEEGGVRDDGSRKNGDLREEELFPRSYVTAPFSDKS